jgi:hypothetical protein
LRNITITLVIFALFITTGCASRGGSAAAGALGGAAAGAGAYEYNVKRQLDQIEEDYKAGRIDKREYEIRKDQIERGSVLR